MYLGTLVGGLGSFPFDYEEPSQSDSRIFVHGIRILIGFGNPERPLVHSVIYHHDGPYEASPKAISERTSYHGI